MPHALWSWSGQFGEVHYIMHCTQRVNPFFHTTHFNPSKKKKFRKTLWKKVKLLKIFTFIHNVFYAICIFKSFNGHISVIVCCSFEFGAVSKWCIREWVKCKAEELFSQANIQCITDFGILHFSVTNFWAGRIVWKFGIFLSVVSHFEWFWCRLY